MAAPAGGSHRLGSFHVDPANDTTPANISGASQAKRFAMNPPVAIPACRDFSLSFALPTSSRTSCEHERDDSPGSVRLIV